MTKALKHVLCVDDSEDILEVAQMCLETMADIKVNCLNSGMKAVEQAVGINPDLILLDVMMPQMDGPTTLQELRKIPELANTPIVFMTARVQPAEVEEYMELGASGVICKPFDPMTIADEIQAVWEKCND
ncbi:MAG: response regulator [Alphaproteobacteria bacterium]|nr:response regulator [Alphaproteobacteria bacterium]